MDRSNSKKRKREFDDQGRESSSRYRREDERGRERNSRNRRGKDERRRDEQRRDGNSKKWKREDDQDRECSSKNWQRQGDQDRVRRREGEQDREEMESCGGRRLDVVPVGAEVLDCPICYLQLRPPILQCSVGHFICSPCSTQLKDNKCHSCRDYSYSFNSCYGMDQVVMSAIENSNKRKGGQQERDRESSSKRMDVACVDTEVLDCPGCHKPLRSPILQCHDGHFVCSPRCAMLLENNCNSCHALNPYFKRCYGMEHVVESAMVPCSNGKYGCIARIAYYQKEEHEYICPNRGPCFCPEPACSFTGSIAMLLDHFTMHHGWPSTTFTFRQCFDIIAKPGMHVFRTSHGHCFLFSITPLESSKHAISVTCIQPYKTIPTFGYILRAPFINDYESAYVDIKSSSLSDGLPTDYDYTLEESNFHKEMVFRMTIYD